jgi:hypothetical protein
MKRVGDTIGDILRSAGAESVGVLPRIAEVWPAAVGDAIARAAWPARLARDGTLHVATTSSVWAFELTSLADDLLSRLAISLGSDTPARIRFAPGRVPEPGVAVPPAGEHARPTVEPTDKARAAVLTAQLGDPDLRETVARAAAASLARARHDRSF